MEDSVSFEFSHKLTKIQKSLYGFILSLVPNHNEAEDILQETNLILCKKAKEYDPSGHFQGWAFKIARFQVMRFLTKTKRNKLQFCSEILEEVAMEEFDARKLQVTQKALAVCYELLPKSMQLVAHLRFKDDKSLKYISKSVKRPMGAISSTLYRIRQKLADCVNEKVLKIESEMDFKKN
ncbi:MAG: sigma-70 family RNA polymerase sigma factor [Verrucomicrobiota bacterium]|nr:sigma-70 family RNA polymerase sigma factor [Verrucomicrobiota bacterium]